MRSRPAGRFGRRRLRAGGTRPGSSGPTSPEPASLATHRARGHGQRPSWLAARQLWSPESYERDEVRSVENLMLVIKEVPPGTPPHDGIQVTKNVDFATYAKKLAESRKPKPGYPKTTVLRIMRPQTASGVQHRRPRLLGRARFTTCSSMCPRPKIKRKAVSSVLPPRSTGSRCRWPNSALSYNVDTSKPNAAASSTPRSRSSTREPIRRCWRSRTTRTRVLLSRSSRRRLCSAL